MARHYCTTSTSITETVGAASFYLLDDEAEAKIAGSRQRGKSHSSQRAGEFALLVVAGAGVDQRNQECGPLGSTSSSAPNMGHQQVTWRTALIFRVPFCKTLIPSAVGKTIN
jgi:hypothetical protein